MPRVGISSRNGAHKAHSSSGTARRRILGDLKQLERDNLAGVSARPLEENLFEWHVNVRAMDGILNEIYIHCVMTFTQDYPNKPPTITCKTPFGHDNIFDNGFICLSMLEDRYGHDWKAYERWSSAYSLTSILLQLQSFVTDLRRVYTEDRHIRRVQDFHCTTCGHWHKNPFPPVFPFDNVRPEGVAVSENDPALDASVSAAWLEIPHDVANLMFACLDAVSIHRASWACREWNEIIESYNLKIRNEIICYHTKLDYRECTLGFGMSEMAGQRNSPYKLHMDYLSDVAWESGVRVSVWGEELVNWIPLIINKTHGTRVHKMLVSRLRDISMNPADAICKLMNGIVIGMAKHVTEGGRSGNGLLMSEKALVGYFALHHMLLWLVHHDERLAKRAKARVDMFLQEGMDGCAQVGDLGESLVYLSCVEHASWSDIQQKFIFETWRRCVPWYVKTQPSLARACDGNCEDIFHETRVSRAIVGFQVFFVTEVCSEDGVAAMLGRYNQKLGRPSRKSIWKLNWFCSEMREHSSKVFKRQYKFYWDSVKIQPPLRKFFIEYLAAASSAYVARGAAHHQEREYPRRRYASEESRFRGGGVSRYQQRDRRESDRNRRRWR